MNRRKDTNGRGFRQESKTTPIRRLIESAMELLNLIESNTIVLAPKNEPFKSVFVRWLFMFKPGFIYLP